jgi:hypothetical protein
VVLGAATAGELAVELRTDRPLGTGLVLLAVSVTDAGGAAVPDATVRLAAHRTPDGGGADLSAPGLASPVAGSDGLHRQLVALPTAVSAAEGWSVAVEVTAPSSTGGSVTFAGLAASERWLASGFPAGTLRYLLAVRFDAGLVAGLNPFTASLHESADAGVSWAPVADAAMAVEPFMPSMGHGASGSVAPAPTATAGEYRGVLAFSMSGDWETTFTVSRAGEELGRPVITVYF